MVGRLRAAVLVFLAATSLAACGAAGDPADDVRDRPLADRLVELEARRLCELQSNAFASPEEADAFVDELLAEVDVTRPQLDAFRAELADDPEAAAEVSALVETRCG